MFHVKHLTEFFCWRGLYWWKIFCAKSKNENDCRCLYIQNEESSGL